MRKNCFPVLGRWLTGWPDGSRTYKANEADRQGQDRCGPVSAVVEVQPYHRPNDADHDEPRTELSGDRERDRREPRDHERADADGAVAPTGETNRDEDAERERHSDKARHRELAT